MSPTITRRPAIGGAVAFADDDFLGRYGRTRILFNEKMKAMLLTKQVKGELVLQRDFVLLRDFMYYYETLPLRRVEGRLSNCERVRLR